MIKMKIVLLLTYREISSKIFAKLKLRNSISLFSISKTFGGELLVRVAVSCWFMEQLGLRRDT